MQRTADNPDGLMTRKGVNYASDAKKEMVKGSEQSRILQTVRGADRLARDLAEAFNATRLQLAEFIGLIKESDAKAKEFVREVSAITHGDYSSALDRNTGVPDTLDVEDAGIFAGKLVEIASTRGFEQRMRMCVKLNALILKAIKGWQSKIDKMKERTTASGATEAEVEVAGAKIVQFNEAISVLRKRGSEVTSAYYDAKREVTGLLARLDREFRPVNYNEEPGHERVVLDQTWNSNKGRE